MTFTSKSPELFSDLPKSGRSSACSRDLFAGINSKCTRRSRKANLERSRSVVEDSLLIKTPLTTQLMVSALESETVNYEDP